MEPLEPGWSNHDPAFVLLGLAGILDEREMEFVAEEVDGFVVVSNDEGNVNDRLSHDWSQASGEEEVVLASSNGEEACALWSNADALIWMLIAIRIRGCLCPTH